MKKNKAIGVVVAIALFLGLLTYTTAVGFGPTGTGAAKNITLGLDLSEHMTEGLPYLIGI